MGLESYGPLLACFCSVELRMLFTFVKDCLKRERAKTKDYMIECMQPAKHKIFSIWPFTEKICQPAPVYNTIQIKTETVYYLM